MFINLLIIVSRQNRGNMIQCYVKAKLKRMSKALLMIPSQLTVNVFEWKGKCYNIFKHDELNYTVFNIRTVQLHSYNDDVMVIDNLDFLKHLLRNNLLNIKYSIKLTRATALLIPSRPWLPEVCYFRDIAW